MWWVIVFIIVVYIYLIAPSFKKRKFSQRKFTHRGYHEADQRVKENSMEAFVRSVKLGYGIELDVQLSKDHEVVVYHDDSLLRLEGQDRLVYDCTLDELRQFDVVTLNEVLETVAGRVMLIVELKAGRNKLLSEKVYEVIKDYKGDLCIESFDPRIVMWFKKHASEVMRGQLVQPIAKYEDFWSGLLVNTMLLHFLTRPHFIAVHVDSSLYNISLRLNQLMGVQSCLWTVHKETATYHKWIDSIIFEYFKA